MGDPVIEQGSTREAARPRGGVAGNVFSSLPNVKHFTANDFWIDYRRPNAAVAGNKSGIARVWIASSTTRSSDRNIWMSGGVTFDETMSGWFASGGEDPEVAAGLAQRDGTRLVMHASVHIPNIDAFLDDPNHTGQLSGRIDYTPLGPALPSTDGVFNLFSPTDAHDTRHMVYELALSAADGPLYFAGHKVVRQNEGLDLWNDTTTLYSRLYRGVDKSGEIIGAGVLRLGVGDLMRLLSTLRPTNDGSAVNVLKFGKMFFGELWDIYAPHIR